MSNTPNLIIDMHTHLFNARYVPLNEILITRNVPPGVSHLLSRLIFALTGRSKLEKMGAFHIHNEDDENEEHLIEVIVELAVQKLGDDARKTQVPGMDTSELLFNAEMTLEDSELYQVLVDINQEFGDAFSTQELTKSSLAKVLIIENVESWYNKGIFTGIKSMVRRFLIKKAMRFVENASDMLDFLLTMMRSEKGLLGRLENYYERHSQNYLLVHHMMDMQYPFDGKVKYSFYKKQLSKMTALERYSRGNAIGFSAFDPYRFVRGGYDNDVIINHLEKALKYGKVGFKFYPPMGYRAANNEGSPRLEEVIDLFFDYCVEHQIPVFTHCTPKGFEAVPGKTGPDAHPKYWEMALTKNETRKQLIVCFGHAGGGEHKVEGEVVRGWLASTEREWKHDDNYARWVVDLCRRFPNVYCEIANIHEIIHDDNEKNSFKNRLITEFKRPKSSSHPYLIEDKIMYGSDWHMPSMINDIEKYLADIVDIFSVEPLKIHVDNFFAGNAIKFLNLGQFITRARKQLNDSCAEELERKYHLGRR